MDAEPAHPGDRGHRWVAVPDQVAATLPGETIVLNLLDGNYYRLAGAGSRIWQSLAQPVAVDEICDAVTTEFDAPSREVVAADVRRLLSDLENKGLVRRVT